MKRALASFRLYPFADRSGLYVRVLIFATRRAMRESGVCNRGDAAAFCSVRTRADGRLLTEIGYIAVPLGDLNLNTIAHECQHATLEFARRKRMPLPQIAANSLKLKEWTGDPEEYLAWCLAGLVEQFVHRVKKLGLSPGI